MSTPFFESTERQDALAGELVEWKGTRFQRHSGGKAVKGVGADCISFVVTVLLDLKALGPVNWPRYVTFGGGESMLALILKCFGEHPELQQIWNGSGQKPALLPGDLFIRTKGADYHHLAIFAGDKNVWHVLQRIGVCESNIDDPFISQHIHSIWRVYEPAK